MPTMPHIEDHHGYRRSGKSAQSEKPLVELLNLEDALVSDDAMGAIPTTPGQSSTPRPTPFRLLPFRQCKAHILLPKMSMGFAVANRELTKSQSLTKR